MAKSSIERAALDAAEEARHKALADAAKGREVSWSLDEARANPVVAPFLAALPMREIKERAGTYGNCGGVAFAFAHLEAGDGPGVEMVDVLEGLDAEDELWRDLIDTLIGYIADGIREGFTDALGGEPPVRVLLYKIDPNPTYANPTYHRRAGRRVAEEALRRAGYRTASLDELRDALPIRGVDVGIWPAVGVYGVARAVVDFEPVEASGVEVVDAVAREPEWDEETADLAAMCVENIGTGVHETLRRMLDAEPAFRLVVRGVHPDRRDASDLINYQVGARVAQRVLWRTATPPPAPPPPAATPRPEPPPPAASPRR